MNQASEPPAEEQGGKKKVTTPTTPIESFELIIAHRPPELSPSHCRPPFSLSVEGEGQALIARLPPLY